MSRCTIKLATLYLLIVTGNLKDGDVLLWDSIDADISPECKETVALIVKRLCDAGVQVVCSCSDFNMCRYLELYAGVSGAKFCEDSETGKETVLDVKFISLERDPENMQISHESSDTFFGLKNNCIREDNCRLRHVEELYGK